MATGRGGPRDHSREAPRPACRDGRPHSISRGAVSTTDHVVRMYIHDLRERFGSMRRLAERALARLEDDEFLGPDPAGYGNGPAVQVKHVAGYLTSRWTDFLDTDGEKPNRDRDGEFVLNGETREDLMRDWDTAWRTLLNSLENLTHADLAKTVTIRGEPHTVPAALNRSLAHTAYHVGQIVQLGREFGKDGWEFLSIPPGGTADHNRRMAERLPPTP